MQTMPGTETEQDTTAESATLERADVLVPPKWDRVAPCQWRSVQHRGINESSLDLSVRLDEHAYRWEVKDGKHSVASGVCKTPGHARACAMRVATDWAATMRPAPARRFVARNATNTVEITSFDREVFPYLIALLMMVNIAYEAVVSARAGSGMEAMSTPVVLGLCCFIAIAVHRNWNNSP